MAIKGVPTAEVPTFAYLKDELRVGQPEKGRETVDLNAEQAEILLAKFAPFMDNASNNLKQRGRGPNDEFVQTLANKFGGEDRIIAGQYDDGFVMVWEESGGKTRTVTWFKDQEKFSVSKTNSKEEGTDYADFVLDVSFMSNMVSVDFPALA